MTANEERESIKTALEHAPAAGPVAPDLRGWWTPGGWFICAQCAGRIMARGCRLPVGSSPVWSDRAEPFGVCVGCESGKG